MQAQGEHANLTQDIPEVPGPPELGMEPETSFYQLVTVQLYELSHLM